jgi:acetyl-CoA acetyltransferase family protein
MREAVIVDAVRTPIGKREGALKGWHPVDLLALTLRSLVTRNQLDPSLVDDCIAGCVMQVGEQSVNIARNAVLAAGFPESVPATTVDRQCGSSQQAIHFAAQGILAGGYDVAIACGVESMTRVPMGASSSGPGAPFGPQMMERYNHAKFHQGIGAEMMAERWNLSRDDLDQFSFESHQRAARATEECRFAKQIVPVPVVTAEGVAEMRKDEGIRKETSVAKMAALKPAFKPDGVVHAGNSSQISDGAAALLLMELQTARRLGLAPMARVAGFALAGDDPVIMLSAPIPATRKLLDRAGLRMGDIDLAEVNEAFASVPLAWQRELDAPSHKNRKSA